MKILAISLLRREPTPPISLASEYDVSSFSFFQRYSVQEFLGFFSATLAEKTAPGLRQAVEQDIYTGYVYTHTQGLTGVIITDHEYPQRVAFTLLNQVIDEFLAKYPRHRWSYSSLSTQQTDLKAASGVPSTPFPALRDYLQRYQNPHEADAILKVQKELDDTKVVLHKTIESMLDRGEKLDQLVDKSEFLSNQSKGFYKVARKTNACSCSIM